MRRAAFLTLEPRGDFVVDDALAIAELATRGWRIDEIPWRRELDWKQFEAVVVRSTWDYQRAPAEFLAKLELISSQVPLANPLEVVRWNIRKTYLRELYSRGVRIVPTEFGEGADIPDLREVPGRHIIKPVLSANANDTFVIDADTTGEQMEHISATFENRAWMVQPFIRSVQTIGEYSVFYFGNRLSHTIVKTPKRGDFRVQEEHGGEIAGIAPPGDVIAAAESVMAAMNTPLLQARVDLVLLDDGAPALMELELIEPSLYFRTDAKAASNFARAFESWVPSR